MADGSPDHVLRARVDGAVRGAGRVDNPSSRGGWGVPRFSSSAVIEVQRRATDGLERPGGSDVDRLEMHAPDGRLLEQIGALADACRHGTAMEDARLGAAWVGDDRAGDLVGFGGHQDPVGDGAEEVAGAERRAP